MEKIGDEYLLLKELGTGGFAKVYKAKNLTYNYIRAIRVLNDYIGDENDNRYKAFLRECGILLRLGNGCHPNIVHIYQPRCLDGRAFVEMDWIDGVDLRMLVEQHGGRVPVDEVIRMVDEIGSALAYCHHDIYRVCYDKVSDKLDDADDGSALITPEIERRLIEKYRVIHNDIHTGNIMRRTDGAYMLLDFGLAVDGKADVVNSSRRQQGAIEFLSARRLDGEDPIPQDDIYSFGCVIYNMLTGHPPFPIEHRNGAIVPLSELGRIRIAHEKEPPPEIERDDVPQWLKDLTMRCLAKRPAERFADGHELHEEIMRHKDEPAAKQPATPDHDEQLAALQAQLDEALQKLNHESNASMSLHKLLDEKTAAYNTLALNAKQLKDDNERLGKAVKQNGSSHRRWLMFLLIAALGIVGTALAMTISLPSKNTVNRLQTENNDLQACVDSLKTMLASSNEEYIVSSNEKTSLQQRIHALEDSVASLQATMTAAGKGASNDKNALQKTIAQLNRDKASLQKQLDERSSTIKKHQKEINNLKSQAAKGSGNNNAQISSLNSKLSAAQSELAASKQRERNLEKKSNEQQQTIANLQKRASTLETQRKTFETKYNEMYKKYQDCLGKL